MRVQACRLCRASSYSCHTHTLGYCVVSMWCLVCDRREVTTMCQRTEDVVTTRWTYEGPS